VIPAEFAADPDAKLLAGGHSLLPLMKLRLATPSLLVDIGRLDELRYVRHGGSVAHGDRASDLPAALLALDASYVLTGPAGPRSALASEFHLGFLETALAPDEILTEIRVPVGANRFVFKKFRGRAIDWAVVGVAAATTEAGVRVALVNMASTPARAHAVEAALAAVEPAGRALAELGVPA
jgi:aerobic carbon-monoxide dehydrogenase medium subunit